MGYVNGSDLLIMVGTKATGHATSHTTTFSTETKDTAVKPLASASSSAAALYKNKRVTGLSVQIKVEGLCFYDETEGGVSEMLGQWKLGASVACKGFARGSDSSPYVSGNFIITSLENTAPAGEDATWSATLDNDGAVTIDESKIAHTSAGSGTGSGTGTGSGN